MRIFEPEYTVDARCVTLRARVELPRGARGLPDILWFKFPRRAEPLVSPGIEPFVVALSSLASAHNERIDIEAPISERLAIGLEEYWAILSGWAPRRFNPVVINTREFISGPARAGNAATLFSGGVIVFHALSRARASRDHRIKLALFIHGMDIPLDQKSIYDAAADAYEDLLGELRVELVRVETNVRAFLPPAFWPLGHGSALIGTALTLAGGVRRTLVPSSKSYATLEPWGSHPLIDGLLGTDNFQVIHHGALVPFQKSKPFAIMIGFMHCCARVTSGQSRFATAGAARSVDEPCSFWLH